MLPSAVSGLCCSLCPLLLSVSSPAVLCFNRLGGVLSCHFLSALLCCPLLLLLSSAAAAALCCLGSAAAATILGCCCSSLLFWVLQQLLLSSAAAAAPCCLGSCSCCYYPRLLLQLSAVLGLCLNEEACCLFMLMDEESKKLSFHYHSPPPIQRPTTPRTPTCPPSAMDTDSLGDELFGMCRSKRNTVAAVEELLRGVSEKQKREVVRYEGDRVSGY